MTDYTKYPEGLEALARDCEMPFEDKESRIKFLKTLTDALIKY